MIARLERIQDKTAVLVMSIRLIEFQPPWRSFSLLVPYIDGARRTDSGTTPKFRCRDSETSLINASRLGQGTSFWRSATHEMYKASPPTFTLSRQSIPTIDCYSSSIQLAFVFVVLFLDAHHAA